MNNDFNSFLLEYLKKQELKTIRIDIGISLFLNDTSKNRRSETIRFYKDHLKPFEIFCHRNNIIEFHEVKQDTINCYVSFLKYNNNQNVTINKRLSILSFVINYLIINNYLTSNNLTYPKLEIKPKEIKVISDDQLKQLISYSLTLSIKKQLIIFLLCSTGIRRNELVNIKISNIDFNHKRIYLDYTKNHKARYVYINDFIIELIKQNINSNCQKILLFENSNAEPLSPIYVTQTLFYIKKELNFEVLSPHKLRHTFATYLLKNGANIEECRRLLGHSNYSVINRYLDYVDNDLQKVCDNMSPLSLIKNK